MNCFTKIESKIWTYRSIRKCDYLWCVSEYTKAEIESLFPNRKAKDIFIGSSINHNFYRVVYINKDLKESLRNKFKIKDKFIIFIGTLEPRKNLNYLIDLMSDIRLNEIQLLVIGIKGWNYSILNKKASSNVLFPGYISSEELLYIYNLADALIFPSINEGFGLPALEAMSCGCPVVAANNSGISEVVEGGGILIEGWNREQWINSILEVINNKDFYKHKGLEKSKTFRWDKISNDLIDYIKK